MNYNFDSVPFGIDRIVNQDASDSAHINAASFYPDVNAHVSSGMNAFARPNSLYSAAATSTPSPSNAPTTARGSQEAVGSEFGPPPSILPPSSQRMIPGSGAQGPHHFRHFVITVYSNSA